MDTHTQDNYSNPRCAPRVTLCRPVFGDRVCPLPVCERKIPSHQNYFDHLNSDHLNNVYGLEVLRNILEDDSQSVLDLASCALSLYRCQSPPKPLSLYMYLILPL